MLTLNGLCAAHGVIVPMQCEYFALEGLTDLVNTIKQVHANLNKDLQIIGLLRVMFDPRITLQQQVSDQLKSHFGDKVFNTVIPRNVRLAEAPSYGLPGVVFDPAARGSQAYRRVRPGDGGAHQEDVSAACAAAAHQPDYAAIKFIAMKPSNVLILPGWENSGPQHWQTPLGKAPWLRARRAARLDASPCAATGWRGWKRWCSRATSRRCWWRTAWAASWPRPGRRAR